MPRDSLALVFDPEIAAKLDRCGIEILDTPQEVMPAALNYLGLDHQSRDPPIWSARRRCWKRCGPYIRRFHSSQYINDLAAGDICLALGYSGDVIQARNRAREAGSPVEIAFRVPREGSQMSIDMLAIPKDAPHPDNAHRFIDYILRPEVIAPITNAVSYPNPNLAAAALIDPEIRDDPGIYPPPEVMRASLYRRTGAACLRAGAHADLEPDQVGLLSGANGAPGDHRNEQVVRRRRRGGQCFARGGGAASSSRCWGRRDAARRRCCG